MTPSLLDAARNLLRITYNGSNDHDKQIALADIAVAVMALGHDQDEWLKGAYAASLLADTKCVHTNVGFSIAGTMYETACGHEINQLYNHCPHCGRVTIEKGDET